MRVETEAVNEQGNTYFFCLVEVGSNIASMGPLVDLI